jgi:hypothetical protein
MQGERVGFAIEKFNERYADLGTTLSQTIRQMKSSGLVVDDYELANLWTANADARGFVVFGDPATRLVPPDGTSQQATDTITPVTVQRREMPVDSTPAFQATTPEQAPETRDPEPPRLSAQGAGARPSLPSAVRLEIEPGTGRIVLTTQPQMPEERLLVAQAPAAPDLAYDLFGRSVPSALDELKDKLTASLKAFADSLGTALTNLAADVTSLQVATYVSDAVDDVQYDAPNHRFVGSVKQRAMTCMRADGDTLVLVPRDEANEIDDTLWSIHMTMVERAQVNRTEMLKMVSSTLADLLNVVKQA